MSQSPSSEEAEEELEGWEIQERERLRIEARDAAIVDTQKKGELLAIEKKELIEAKRLADLEESKGIHLNTFNKKMEEKTKKSDVAGSNLTKNEEDAFMKTFETILTETKSSGWDEYAVVSTPSSTVKITSKTQEEEDEEALSAYELELQKQLMGASDDLLAAAGVNLNESEEEVTLTRNPNPNP